MEDVNWILKLRMHASWYLHSKPPTSLLNLPNRTREWAYEINRALTVSTAAAAPPLTHHGGLLPVRGSQWQGHHCSLRPWHLRREGFQCYSVMDSKSDSFLCRFASFFLSFPWHLTVSIQYQFRKKLSAIIPARARIQAQSDVCITKHGVTVLTWLLLCSRLFTFQAVAPRGRLTGPGYSWDTRPRSAEVARK